MQYTKPFVITYKKNGELATSVIEAASHRQAYQAAKEKAFGWTIVGVECN